MTTQTPDWKRWLERANDDLRWAHASLKEDVLHGVCFAAQQAAEKALKGYILHAGKQLRRIHDLSAILEECIEIDKSFEQLIDQSATLSGYYVEARYPDIGDFMGYTDEQAAEALQFAQEIVQFVGGKLGR